VESNPAGRARRDKTGAVPEAESRGFSLQERADPRYRTDFTHPTRMERALKSIGRYAERQPGLW